MKLPSTMRTLLATPLLVLVLAAAHVQAQPAELVQSPAAPAMVFVTPKDPPVPLLWKVSDADNAVYLLGSFHLLKPDDYPLSSDVNDAFADAGSLVFELPPEEMNSPQLALQMMQAALRSDDSRLDGELPPVIAAKLAAWESANAPLLAGMGMTPERLQMFEPWFVGLMISLVEMGKHGLDPKLGLDQHFIAAAGFAHKPTSGFETGAEQIGFLDGMSPVEQRQFLDEALAEASGGEAEIDRLHEAWRNGDADAIWNEMAVDMQSRYPNLYRRINVERNDAWVPKIAAMLDTPGKQDVLVVVGALHLLGDDGVVEKLRAKGYAVERVCSADPASCLRAPYNDTPAARP